MQKSAEKERTPYDRARRLNFDDQQWPADSNPKENVHDIPWTFVKSADDATEMCQIMGRKKSLYQIVCKWIAPFRKSARQPFISVEEQHLALSEAKHFGIYL